MWLCHLAIVVPGVLDHHFEKLHLSYGAVPIYGCMTQWNRPGRVDDEIDLYVVIKYIQGLN